ncbi:MAG: protein kinase, partial [Verrucomicrobiaceae bacterium]|nr:protein kinase [Verrucomicrobiaceae bacterium]
MPFDVPSVEEMSALLPQYEFEKLAAFGGMGAVYKARQASLDRPVAVKILPPSFGVEQDFADRFKSEARAMARLNHTHIVAVYDFGITTEGHLYLVMEWVEGPTIHELIQKGTIPVRKVANLAIQLCDALHFAHSHKILHRDIKPGNIMVNQEDQVKVADFGLARPITGEAEENPFGTPDYAAPEIMAKAAVDQRADIFAAGIVLYEMLTGRVPRHPRRSVTEFSPVSTRWDEIIAKATDPNPELRYQDVRDFRTGIMMAISQSSGAPLPVAMRVEDPVPVAAPAFSPVKLAAIAAMLIAGIGGGFIALRSGEDSGPEKTVAVSPGPPEPETGKKEPVEAKSETSHTTPPTAAPPEKAPETAPPAPLPEKPAVVVAPAPEPMKTAETPPPA